MSSSSQLMMVIGQPEALRGIDNLIERARRVLDRYMRIPERKTEQKQLPRAA